MKQWKKLALCGIVSVSLLSLAACGTKDDTTDKNNTSTDKNTEAGDTAG